MDKKIILTGRNHKLINSFYSELGSTYKFFTCSMCKQDLMNHIEALQPVAVICCLSSEVESDSFSMAGIRDILPENNAIMGLIGSKEECRAFQKPFSFEADFILVKPITDEEIFNTVKLRVEEKIKMNEEKEKKHPGEAGVEVVAKTRKHVLVVDDDPLMLKVIKEHLHDKYDVATSTNGITALKFLDKHTTDLIVLDYEMPEMNGPEVLNTLRSSFKTSQIPVVFLTGTKDRDKVRNALMLKPQGYLLKPVEKDKLLEMIKMLIG